MIKDLALVKDPALARTNLNTALRGAALTWYTAELDDLHQEGLRGGRGVDSWCSMLTKRFKEFSGLALTKLANEKYTVQDARNRRVPSGYCERVNEISASGYRFVREHGMLGWVRRKALQIVPYRAA